MSLIFFETVEDRLHEQRRGYLLDAVVRNIDYDGLDRALGDLKEKALLKLYKEV